jgi:hypothetical protein
MAAKRKVSTKKSEGAKRPIGKLLAKSHMKKVSGGQQATAGTEYYYGEEYKGCSWTWTPFVG